MDKIQKRQRKRRRTERFDLDQDVPQPKKEFQLSDVGSVDVREDQRLKVNSRERERMHNMNGALDALRAVMPYAQGPSVKKLSKMNTLLLARNYIMLLNRTIDELRTMLAQGYTPGRAAVPPTASTDKLARCAAPCPAHACPAPPAYPSLPTLPYAGLPVPVLMTAPHYVSDVTRCTSVCSPPRCSKM